MPKSALRPCRHLWTTPYGQTHYLHFYLSYLSASFQLESEDEEIVVEIKSEPFVEKGTCLINLNTETYQQLTCQDLKPEERTEVLNTILKDVFPKCALSFQNFESVCKFNSCGLKIRISLNEDAQR